MALTEKQTLFVEHYVQCWNGTKAAESAGYNGGIATCAVAGSRMLKLDKIQKAIKLRLSESAMPADECLSRLARHARSEDMKAMKALELIGKHHSLFTDRIEHSGHIDYTNMSDEKLKELAGRG
jgi:phage terminase small subunit